MLLTWTALGSLIADGGICNISHVLNKSAASNASGKSNSTGASVSDLHWPNILYIEVAFGNSIFDGAFLNVVQP